MIFLELDEPTLNAKIKQALKEVLMELGIEKLKNEPTERRRVTKKWIKENYNKMSYPTIDARIKDGTLKAYRMGKLIYFYEDEIDSDPINFSKKKLKITKQTF